jgi:hypothetical protein
MEKINDGGPAFPQNDATVNRLNNIDGMSLRDYFAGQALMGSLACPNSVVNTVNGFASVSYMLADAMIKAREGK